MDQNTSMIISTAISTAGAVIVALITNKKTKRKKSIKKGDAPMKSNPKKDRIITVTITLFSLIILYVGSQFVIAKTSELLTSNSPSPFTLYSDAGIPQGDILVWSGASWGKAAPTLVNSAYNTNDAPEGNSCFATIGGPGDNNYVGWGIFLGNFNSEHQCIKPNTIDLSSFERLRFYVKSDIDLKIEIQQDNSDGNKSFPCRIKDYGWDTESKGRFVEISIPLNRFGNVDPTKIYCPFMITGTGSKATFYVDDIRWIP